MLMRAKRDHHLNKSESLYQIFILLVFLIHKRDLVITCVKNKLSISFLILKNDNINSLCIVCGSFDFPVICKKNKLLLNLVKDLMRLIFRSVEKPAIQYVIIVNIKYKSSLH